MAEVKLNRISRLHRQSSFVTKKDVISKPRESPSASEDSIHTTATEEQSEEDPGLLYEDQKNGEGLSQSADNDSQKTKKRRRLRRQMSFGTFSFPNLFILIDQALLMQGFRQLATAFVKPV